MISRLSGRLLELGSDRLVVDCHGVGYEVHASQGTLASAGEIGEDVDLYVRQIIREDEHLLYGFLTPGARRLFDLLREVKGCGAKISLAVLDTLGEEGAAAALASGDARALAQTSGVGPKLAERMILELKDKAAAVGAPLRPVVKERAAPTDELVEALMALGYRRGEAEEAAGPARAEAEDLEGRLRAALRRLNR
ncbi:MAG: Holliday junction branch migration protein RuvA [Fimbriimonadaceae bacterium]|nr:Holliday junction branch migration protein RuvA [Fimbriimonadaceae bacterium]